MDKSCPSPSDVAGLIRTCIDLDLDTEIGSLIRMLQTIIEDAHECHTKPDPGTFGQSTVSDAASTWHFFWKHRSGVLSLTLSPETTFLDCSGQEPARPHHRDPSRTPSLNHIRQPLAGSVPCPPLHFFVDIGLVPAVYLFHCATKTNLGSDFWPNRSSIGIFRV